jgi:pilus assembly protein FimV
VTPPAVAASPPPAVARTETTPPAATPAATPSASGSSSSNAATGSPSASAEMPSGAAPSSSSEGSQAGSDTYGPVQKGETLRKIAEQVKPSSVSMEQMLVSLYRQNQAAFSGNNMNRLKTGQILKVPSADEISAVEQKEANREIRTHVADWKTYRESLAGGVAALPTRAETSNAATGRVSSAAVTPPAPPTSEGKDVLKLSKSDVGGKAGASKGGGGGSADRDRINSLQEEVTAKDKALRESQSRVADLEKQIQDMRRLMDLKAGVPGKSDTKVATAPPAATKAEPPKPAEPAKVETKPEPPKVAIVEPPKSTTTDTKSSTSTTPSTTTTTTDASKAAAPPKPAEAPKTEPKAAAKKPAPPARSWTDDLADNWIYLAGAGVLAIVLIGGFLFVRRRKAGAEAGPSSAMTSAFPSDLKPSTGTGKGGGGLVDTGNSSFLTDFDKTGPGAIDTDEVDPVAEAEVYIAYGRDAQAEEILKEAMARDKNRHEIALKLLEIYHARKSATAFETVAKELHAAVGESSPLWQKAAAMGHQIDPQNALYAAAAASGATYTPSAPSAAKPDVDFSADTAAPAPDFDLDAGSKAQVPDLPAETAHTMDFETSSSLAPVDVPAAPAEPAHEDKPSFDFDLSGLDLGKSSSPTPSASSSSSSSNIDLADLSLDTPPDTGGEAVGTKLELAKAYLEIGDKDGAREILNEVAKEGSASQREEAKKLISSL